MKPIIYILMCLVVIISLFLIFLTLLLSTSQATIISNSTVDGWVATFCTPFGIFTGACHNACVESCIEFNEGADGNERCVC